LQLTLYLRLGFLQSVFTEESKNPVGSEFRERSALVVQQREFISPSGGRGEAVLAMTKEILAKEEVVLVVVG